MVGIFITKFCEWLSLYVYCWRFLYENVFVSLCIVCVLLTKYEVFYPPKGTEGGPIVFTFVLFCVRKRISDFQFKGGFLPF